MIRTGARRKGSVLVETALVFLAFASMLIGALDFGQFLFIQQALVERARYAARWGATNDPADFASITNMVLYNQSAEPAAGTRSYLGLTAANVSVSNPDPGTSDYRLSLKISGYPYTMLSPYIAGVHTGPKIVVTVPLGLY